MAPLAGVAIGVSMVAWAQAGDTQTAGLSPDAQMLLALVEHGGLPAVLAILGWYLRGVAANGVPVVAHLHEDDRRLFRELVDSLREGR